MSAANSSWRTIELQGSAPWGFRITDSRNQIQPGLRVSKVRTRSNAYSAGLRDNDIILSINDIPTHSMTLQKASDLIDSCQILRLAVFSSSSNKQYDENQHNNSIKENNNNNFGLANDRTTTKNNNFALNSNHYTTTTTTNFQLQNRDRTPSATSIFRDRTPSVPVNRDRTPSITITSYSNNIRINPSCDTSGSTRVFKNPAFSKFKTLSQQQQEQQQQQFLSPKPRIIRNYQTLPSYRQQHQQQFTQPQQQQQQPRSFNNTTSTSTMRRNYYSATESCGEETDIDDSVFVTDNNSSNNTKQSYASITLKPSLRPPLKDVNYFSDTETMQQATTNTARNFFKQKQQQQQQHQYQQQQHNFQPRKPFAQQPSRTYSERSESAAATPTHAPPTSLNFSSNFNAKPNIYQPAMPKPFTPVAAPSAASIAAAKAASAAAAAAPSNKSFSLLSNKNPRPFNAAAMTSTNDSNPYSPSFKQPNAFNYQQQQPLFNYQDSNVNQYAPNNEPEEQEDSVYDPYKKYELEMGTELLKHSEKPNYSDSFFYNNPSFNYPTIDDQKQLARVIASTLEGSDPNTSKYHKLKRKQLNSQGDAAQTPTSPFAPNPYALASPSAASHNEFVYDENIPEVIRKSIQQAETYDPVRQVFATEEFKPHHFTQHTTHTEMPPQAAMSLAAALHQAGGRGAQIFQKRKAKSEKWVIDDSNVKKSPFGNFGAPPPMHKFVPPASPQVPVMPPMPALPRKPLMVPQKHEESQNRFADFNSKPRGWNTGEEQSQTLPRYGSQPRQLSIDRSIREGIQELHFSNEPRDHSQPRQASPLPPPQQQQQQHDDYMRKFTSQPNKIDLTNWNSQRELESEQRNINMTKDGIQSLKQRLNADAHGAAEQPLLFQKPKTTPSQFTYEPSRLNETFSPVPTISKVKLNKLSTNTPDFLSNTSSNRGNQNSFDPYGASSYAASYQPNNFNDDEIAASDL